MPHRQTMAVKSRAAARRGVIEARHLRRVGIMQIRESSVRPYHVICPKLIGDSGASIVAEAVSQRSNNGIIRSQVRARYRAGQTLLRLVEHIGRFLKGIDQAD